MDRPRHDEIPLHDTVLSNASTSEEIMLSHGQQSADAIAGGVDEGASAVIGTGGETTSEERLSNDGGVG